MARGGKRDKSHLGDSWVVNDSSDADDSGGHMEDDTPRPRTTKASASQRRRNSRAASREAEFVMPRIGEDGMAGSWTGGTGAARDSLKKRNLRGSTPSITNEEVVTRRRGNGETKQRAPSTRMSQVEDGSDSDVWQSVLAILQPIGGFLWDIVGGVFKALKTPIIYAITVYVFVGLIAVARNMLFNSIYTALSPICRVPGMSLLNLPMCNVGMAGGVTDYDNPPVEFDQLMTVQSQFEDILEQSASGVSLPMDMKRGETSIRDLRQIVRFSHLPSRNELVLEFDGFIETARMASYDLQRFNSHVGRGVDSVLATARWTRRVLDDISESKQSRGLIPSFINDRLLAPFQPINKFSESALTDQYIKHTRVVEDEIHRLISEAQALLQVLANIEDRLEVIQEISLRDNIQAEGSRDEILSQLWTMLGGNRVALGKYNSQLQLLKHVGQYRKAAFAHVSATTIRLQAMGAELEELRERVGTPELLRDTGRTEIPLSVHIENIERGVERLEGVRINAKRLENEQLRRVLDRDEPSEIRLVEG